MEGYLQVVVQVTYPVRVCLISVLLSAGPESAGQGHNTKKTGHIYEKKLSNLHPLLAISQKIAETEEYHMLFQGYHLFISGPRSLVQKVPISVGGP